MISSNQTKETQPASNQKLLLDSSKSNIMTKCVGSKKATFMCTNEKCKQQCRFTCGSQDCKCQIQHQLCLRANLNSILKVIQKKNKSTDGFKKFIDDSINKVIDELSDFREQLLALVDTQMQFVEEYDVEREFVDFAKKNKQQSQKFDSTNAALLWKIITSKDFGVNQLFQETKKILKKVELASSLAISNFNKQLNVLIEKQIQNHDIRTAKLKNRLTPSKQQLSNIQQNIKKIILAKSSVVKTSQLSERLIKFFPKSLKNMTLLYKASVNNFKLNKFYEICGQVPNTLILCESNRGKIVGGYTPLCHYEQNLDSDYVWVVDPTFESFICELTSDRKFFLHNKDQAISISKNKDQICFGDQEIKIVDDANINKLCNLDVNLSYKNNQFVSNDSRYRLNGFNFQTCNLVEWEVWKIQFQT